jgi:hypothetical protein
MLHAIHNRKSRLPFLRYVAGSDGQGHRRTQEDEITSIVFGPLDFMPEATTRSIVTILFGCSPIPETHRVSMKLWPRYENVEPDVVFIEHCDNGTERAYIIEVKWNAPLGDDQVDRQRTAMRDSAIEVIEHIVLSRYPIEVGSNSKNKTWMDFKDDILKGIKDNDKDQISKKWAELTWSFLESCNVLHFRGFSSIADCSIGPKCAQKYIFWFGSLDWSHLDLPSESFASRCPKHTFFYPKT